MELELTPPNANGHNTGLRKMMQEVHGIKAEHGKRQGLEQRYFFLHKKNGVKLRGKYRYN